MSQKLPVLIVAFNRPELTSRVLDAVVEYSPSKVYLACDGPRKKSKEEDDRVFAVRELMSKTSFACESFTRFEEKNQGLQTGVTNAIDWFFRLEPEGIILEDDCLPGNGFFEFCEMILDRYRNEPRVWGAGGYNPTGISFPGSSYGFIRFAMIWGWATWADRWANYDRDLMKYREEALTGKFAWPSRGLYHGLDRHLRQISNGQLETWDYQWSWSVASNGGLWAMPDRNLVKNMGFGLDSTNTTRPLVPDQELQANSPLRHPEHIAAGLSENLFLRRNLRVYRPYWLNYLRNGVRQLKKIYQDRFLH